MKYDLVATLLFIAIMNADLTFRIQGQHTFTDYVMTAAAVQSEYEPDEVRIFYDLALTYLALVALPFVVFACPFVGELLHQMRFTAYDQMGRLRLQMEPWQMMEKKKEEDHDHEEEEKKHLKEEREHKKEEERAQAQMRAKLHKERKALQKREKKQQKKKSSPTGKGATDLV